MFHKIAIYAFAFIFVGYGGAEARARHTVKRGTVYNICKAENGCPWPGKSEFIRCGDPEATAKNLCSRKRGDKSIYGLRESLKVIGGPMASGTEFNGVKCESGCGCALYSFKCLDF